MLGFEALEAEGGVVGPGSLSLVGYPTVTEGQPDPQIPNGFRGPGLAIAIQYDQVGEAALLQHPLASFRELDPGTVPRVAGDGLVQGLRLLGLARAPGLAGDRGLDGEQRVERGDRPVAGEAQVRAGVTELRQAKVNGSRASSSSAIISWPG